MSSLAFTRLFSRKWDTDNRKTRAFKLLNAIPYSTSLSQENIVLNSTCPVHFGIHHLVWWNRAGSACFHSNYSVFQPTLNRSCVNCSKSRKDCLPQRMKSSFFFFFFWENENQFLTGKSIFWRNVCSCVNSNYVLTCPRGCWFIAVTSVVDFDNVIGNDDFNDATFY